jgi:hypothetical protein
MGGASHAQAALVVRGIADGYAILSGGWSDRDRATLALPTRDITEWTIRHAGLDHWAADQGHPLDLHDSTEAVEAMLAEARPTMLEQQAAEHDDLEQRLASVFSATVHTYELFSILCDTPRGREAARDERINAFAVSQLSSARQSVVWATHLIHDTAAAPLAILLMAQARFVIAQGGATSSTDLFPSRAVVRKLLDHSDARDWLASHGAELPSWLSVESGWHDPRRVAAATSCPSGSDRDTVSRRH